MTSRDIRPLILKYMDNSMPLICDGELFGMLQLSKKKSLRSYETIYENITNFREWIQDVTKTWKDLKLKNNNILNWKKTELKELICISTVRIILEDEEVCSGTLTNETTVLSTATCCLKSTPIALSHFDSYCEEEPYLLEVGNKVQIQKNRFHNSTGRFHDLLQLQYDPKIDMDFPPLRSWEDSDKEYKCLCGFRAFPASKVNFINFIIPQQTRYASSPSIYLYK